MMQRLISGVVCCLCLGTGFPVCAAMIVTVEIEFTKNEETRHKKHLITIDGDRVRFDFLGTQAAKTEQTPYLLTVDGGRNYVLGNKQKGKFYCARVEPVDFFKRLGASLTSFESLVKPDTLEIKLTRTMQEPGPEILGYPTTHVRLVMTAEAEASFLFKKYKSVLRHTDDLWYTTAAGIQPFKKLWIEAMVQTGYPRFDELFRERARYIPGPILRLESEMVTTNMLGDETTVELEKARITSIDEVKSSDIPEQVFEVPDCRSITQKQLISTAVDIFGEGKTGW